MTTVPRMRGLLESSTHLRGTSAHLNLKNQVYVFLAVQGRYNIFILNFLVELSQRMMTETMEMKRKEKGVE